MLDGPTTARPSERRTRDRFPCVEPGTLSAMASLGTHLLKAPVHNISMGGIGMVLDCRVDPGTLLAVELLNRAEQFWHLKLLRVVHATQTDDDRWLVGSSFLRSFTDAEFRALVKATS